MKRKLLKFECSYCESDFTVQEKEGKDAVYKCENGHSFTESEFDWLCSMTKRELNIYLKVKLLGEIKMKPRIPLPKKTEKVFKSKKAYDRKKNLTCSATGCVNYADCDFKKADCFL